MPWPAKLSPGNGALQIDAGFGVSTSGYSDTRLQAAIARLTNRLSRVTGRERCAEAPRNPDGVGNGPGSSGERK